MSDTQPVTGEGTTNLGPDAPLRTAGWVAQRLGIAPATLRVWQCRYGVRSTIRTAGGHSRYSPADVARLERMRQLVLVGVPVAQAAQISHGLRPEPPPASSDARETVRRRGGGRVLAVDRAKPELQRLAGAAMALDDDAIADILVNALRQHGVIATWDELIVPVLRSIGARYARTAECIDVEHLFTERVRLELSAITACRRRWNHSAPVLLGCPDGEQHALPLHALAAALAEVQQPSRVLGPSVPTPALTSAVRRIKPSAVFLWSQLTQTAHQADLASIPRQRPPARIVVGGPGWEDRELPAAVTRAATLAEAVQRLGPPRTGHP